MQQCIELAQKGQIKPRLERITEPLKTLASSSNNHHKLSNNEALRTIWCGLGCALEQGWLGSLVRRYIGLFSTCVDPHLPRFRCIKRSPAWPHYQVLASLISYAYGCL